MKSVFTFLALLAITASAQEAMNAERFKSIVAKPGDTTALRPELSALPFWPKVKTTITLEYQDGKTHKEETTATAKTVEGNYIVLSLDSKYYKQTMHAVTGFDEKAKAIRTWALFGEVLTESTMVVDPKRKTSAGTAAYGDGFTEISVNSYSDRGAHHRAQVFKNGVLFMTREEEAHPIQEPPAK